MTTESTTQKYTEQVQQSQQAVLSAIDAWNKTVQDAVAQMPKAPGQFDATGMVDQVFDLTEKVLDMQRDLAKKLITASGAATDMAAGHATEPTPQQ
ncbi:hypothetical protein [Lapillicoccus sp.]|uniref:hypothetical protein n=1 Tax=Lapillicoccus sp. TaxID=1909287 RepID=UPI00326401A1